jgi:hypothetical protein
MGRTAEAVAEGLQIADAAVRLAIKNHILVETIAHDEGFDAQAFTPFARDTLVSLAEEQERGAQAMQRLGKKAWGQHSDPNSTHDYRDRDVRNLRRRRRQYQGVAKALRAQSADETALLRLVEEARGAAWAEVAANLQRRLRVEGMRPEADPDYESMRDARMAAVTMIDLQRLAAQARRKTAATESAEAIED